MVASKKMETITPTSRSSRKFRALTTPPDTALISAVAWGSSVSSQVVMSV